MIEVYTISLIVGMILLPIRIIAPVSNSGMESLEWLTKQPNIYFVDLKDLSNPKFHEWLTIKDGKWSEVDWIDYKALYSDERN